MLDACHSGALGAQGKRAKASEWTRELSDDDCGVVVMCAAMDREEAGEQDGHGFFAKAVIEGLSGRAAGNKVDRRVTLLNLYQYVNDRVIVLSEDAQHPVIGIPTSVRPFFSLAAPE
jgi:uncharacterized caspase-like protein